MAVRATRIAPSADRFALSADTEGEGGNPLRHLFTSARRYWWVVAGVAVLAVLGALVATAAASTTYTGRTSLIVSSNDRSPEQDAVLVQGYVSYFDDLAYQHQLLTEAGVDLDSEITAQAAAASPIVVITATAGDEASAQAAAIAVAEVFRKDINEVHDRTTASALATAQNQLDTALARRSKDDQAVIAALQERIRELQNDQDNVLQGLQSRGGVTAQPPSLTNNLALGLVGGMLLGLLLALALARTSPRLRSQVDVLEKVGLATLIELPVARGNGAAELREQRLRQLANALRASLGGPAVLAVTQADDNASSWGVARGLAIEWATQGYPTVWIRFGGGVESPRSVSGETPPELIKPVEASATLSRIRSGPVPGLSVIDMRLRLVGGATMLPPSKLTELLKLEPLVGAFVVIETSALVTSAAAQSASLAADATILVIDTQVARVGETREAVDVLRQCGVGTLGAVLAPGSGEQSHHGEGEVEGGNAAQSGRGSGAGNAGWSW
jgi:capsular polysaccharide biosynthesis protein